MHGKSNTVYSVLFASIILKFCPLILVRFGIQVTDYWLLILLSSFFAACQMFKEKDFKTTLAYLSIIHMNLYLFVCNPEHFAFNLIQHSFVMAFLFFICELLKQNLLPKTLFIVSILIAIEIPFTWGFVSEIITIKSIVNYNPYIALCSILILLIPYSKLLQYYCTTVLPISSNLLKSQKLCLILLIIIIFTGYLYLDII